MGKTPKQSASFIKERLPWGVLLYEDRPVELLAFLDEYMQEAEGVDTRCYLLARALRHSVEHRHMGAFRRWHKMALKNARGELPEQRGEH